MESEINDAVIAGYVNPQNSSDKHTESLNSILLGMPLFLFPDLRSKVSPVSLLFWVILSVNPQRVQPYGYY